MQDNCTHDEKPCGMAASSLITGTMLELCAVLEKAECFIVIQSSQMVMCHMYHPDAVAMVSRYFVHSFGQYGIHQGVCNVSIPCCVNINLCCVKQGYCNSAY